MHEQPTNSILKIAIYLNLYISRHLLNRPKYLDTQTIPLLCRYLTFPYKL